MNDYVVAALIAVGVLIAGEVCVLAVLDHRDKLQQWIRRRR